MIQADLIQLGTRETLMFLPLSLASLGLICSIIGIAIILAPVLIRTWREFRTVR